jgi:predicted phosphodiesterase
MGLKFLRSKRTRKSSRPADAVLTADLHLTSKTPVSRTDNYIQAQERKLLFLQELSQQNNDCPILCAGDVFDHWKASPWLCSWAHHYLPNTFITIPGNHDLPMHSLAEYEKSALSLLETVGGQISVLRNDSVFSSKGIEVIGVPFGELEGFTPARAITPQRVTARILLIHELIWPGNRPGWANNSYTADEILDRFGDYFDLIVSGDNHQSFVIEGEGGSLLVNPGSMMRSTISQSDFQPHCYLYYASENKVIRADFPIEQNVHKSDLLDGRKDREERITAYIEKLSDNWDKGLSFKDNLEAFFQENKTPRKVREIIWQYLETK